MSDRGARRDLDAYFKKQERDTDRGSPRSSRRSSQRSSLARAPRAQQVSSSLLGPVDPSFQALSGRLKFTVRRHKFNKDSLS